MLRSRADRSGRHPHPGRLILCFLHTTLPKTSFTPCIDHSPASAGNDLQVTLSDEVLETYNKHNTWKFIIFGLVNNNTEIGVIKASLSAKYDDFLHELPKDDCRWAVYDLEYDSGEGKKTKRVFYDWCVPNRLQVIEDWRAHGATSGPPRLLQSLER